MRGYDYGFTDSINFAFYNEMKLIKSKVRKLCLNKISNLEIIKIIKMISILFHKK